MNTYQEGYKRQFFVKSGTFQHVFCILIWYLILALPFYFSFGGESNFCDKSRVLADIEKRNVGMSV